MTGATMRDTVIVVDSRSAGRVGGMTVLERLLFEVSVAVDQGLLPAAVTLRHRAGERPRSLRRPANLQITWATEPESRGDGPVLLVGGWIVPTRGALAGWLAAGARSEEVAGLPLVIAADASASRFTEGAAPGGPEVVQGAWGTIVAVPGRGRLRTASRVLYRSLARPSDGFCAARINRPISRLVTRLLVALGVRPNQWSLLLLSLPIAGAALMARGDGVGLLAGIWLYNTFSILDGCDGEIARLTYRTSPQGARLDTMSDMGTHVLFGLALGTGLARQPGLSVAWSRAYLLEGVATAVATAGVTLWIAHNYRRQAHLNDFGPAVVAAVPVRGRWAWLAGQIARFLKQDTYNWVFAVLATVGSYGLVLHGLAFGVAVHVIAAVAMGQRGHARASLRAEAGRQP